MKNDKTEEGGEKKEDREAEISNRKKETLMLSHFLLFSFFVKSVSP